MSQIIVQTDEAAEFDVVQQADQEGALPPGGTTRQALVKNTGNDFDVTWTTIDYTFVGAAPTVHTHELADILDAGTLAAKNIIATADITDQAITFAKIQHSTSNTLLGTNNAGIVINYALGNYLYFDTNGALNVDITDLVPDIELSQVGKTGQYSDLLDKPTFAPIASTGSYTDLINTPTLALVATSGNWHDLVGRPTFATIAFTGAYADLSGVPVLSDVAISGQYNDLAGVPTLATVATSGSYTDLVNAPAFATIAITGDYLDLANVPDFVHKNGNSSIVGNIDITGNLSTDNLAVRNGLVSLGSNIAATSDIDIGLYGVYSPNSFFTLSDSTGNLELSDLSGTFLSNNDAGSTFETSDGSFFTLSDNSGNLANNDAVSNTVYTGLYRDSTDGKFKLFDGLTVQPTNTVPTEDSSYQMGTLVANIEGTVSSLSNHIFPLLYNVVKGSLVAGSAIYKFRMPVEFSLQQIRINVSIAPSGQALVVDFKVNGTSILSTPLSIDADQRTSVTSANPPVYLTQDLPDDAEITIDLLQVGSTVAGSDLKLTLLGNIA